MTIHRAQVTRIVGEEATPEVYLKVRDLLEDRERLQQRVNALVPWQRIVSDLDRNEHGRHERDVDGNRVSEGNPFAPTGTVLGFGLHSDQVIVMPAPLDRFDPGNWYRPCTIQDRAVVEEARRNRST